MRIIYSILFTTILVLVVFGQTGPFAGDLNAFYSSDYEGFWKHWNQTRQQAISCSSTRNTAMFLSNALIMLGNAEVSEANAEVIENLAIANPECLLNGIDALQDSRKELLIKSFLVTPIYKDSSSIEKALDRVWQKGNYTNLRAIFRRARHGR